MNRNDMVERVSKIIDALNEGLHDRREIVAVAFLAAVAGHHTFLLGPPGTAKSLIARRISRAFEGALEEGQYFEYLMNRYSTPDEVFGPVSLFELKENDRYKRKTERYLPTAKFAFLDEIWKSGTGILNALLTLLNEGIYHNGNERQGVPLKALISASNETPQEGEGLDALYDRFLVRLIVDPLDDPSSFKGMIRAEPAEAKIQLGNDLTISEQELTEWRKAIASVTLSDETLEVIDRIRADLLKNNDKGDDNAIYVSDRRWQRAAHLLKASAFLCGRDEANQGDALILRHCLWETKKSKEKTTKFVKKAIQRSAIPTRVNLKEIDMSWEALLDEIKEELTYTKPKYKTVEMIDSINWEEVPLNCFKVKLSSLGVEGEEGEDCIYLPEKYIYSKDAFEPRWVEEGRRLKGCDPRFICSFNGKKTCTILYQIRLPQSSLYHSHQTSSERKILPRFKKSETDRYVRKVEETYTPTIQHKKGVRKDGVDGNIVKELMKKAEGVKEQYETKKEELFTLEKEAIKQVATPFVTDEDLKFAYENNADQVEELESRIKQCDNAMVEYFGVESIMGKAS